MNDLPIKKRLVAIVLQDSSKERLLLQHRDATAPTSPLLWSLPGGEIEPGETADEAIWREVLEETGLHLEMAVKLFWSGLLPSISQPGSCNEWYAFSAYTQARQEDIVVGEGDAMVFVPLKQVFTFDLAVSTQALLALWHEQESERSSRSSSGSERDPTDECGTTSELGGKTQGDDIFDY